MDNKQDRSLYFAKYRELTREKTNKRNAKYREANKEAIKERNQIYHEKNKEVINAKRRIKYAMSSADNKIVPVNED